MRNLLLSCLFLLNSICAIAQINSTEVYCKIINDSVLHVYSDNRICISGIPDSISYTLSSPGFTAIPLEEKNCWILRTKYHPADSIKLTVFKRGGGVVIKKFILPLKAEEDNIAFGRVMEKSDTSKTKVISEGLNRNAIYLGNVEEDLVNNFIFPSDYKIKKEGKILLKVVIEPTGTVGNVTIDSSDFPELNKAAFETAKKLKKWNPALQNGNPVRTVVIIPFNIKP